MPKNQFKANFRLFLKRKNKNKIKSHFKTLKNPNKPLLELKHTLATLKGL